MARRKPKTTSRSEGSEGRPLTEGAPGTRRGLAGTAGTEGENVARSDRSAGARGTRGGRSDRGGAEAGRASGPGWLAHQRGLPEELRGVGGGESDHLGEAGVDEEGVSGEGVDESGTVPGSTGGTTGTSGHAGGIQSPGSAASDFRGISPEEAERRRREGAKHRAEQ